MGDVRRGRAAAAQRSRRRRADRAAPRCGRSTCSPRPARPSRRSCRAPRTSRPPCSRRGRRRGGARRAGAGDRRPPTARRSCPATARADHPPAARQAAPPRRRRPARAAGLGAGARRPAAVRDHAQQPDRRGHRGVSAVEPEPRAELRGVALARPHRRPQDRRVGRPARRGVGGGPARAGHRAAGHGHRVPRPARSRRRRVAAAHRARSGWSATAAPAVAEGNRVVVHGKPSFFLGRGTLSLRVDDDPRGRDRRAAGPHRAPAQAAGRRGAVRRRPQAPSAVPARAASGSSRAGRRPPSTTSSPTRRPAGPRSGSGSSTPPCRARWPCRRSSTRSGVLDRDPDVDVIVLARGGGSVEDLLPFSDETLCRAVAACRTPVVSAIGHEPDTPLVDHVADLRCSTPTEAGRRLVPDLARGDRADRGPARPGPPRAGRLGGPRAAGCSRPCAHRPVLADPLRRSEARHGEVAPAARRCAAPCSSAGWTGARTDWSTPAPA